MGVGVWCVKAKLFYRENKDNFTSSGQKKKKALGGKRVLQIGRKTQKLLLLCFSLKCRGTWIKHTGGAGVL